MTGIDPLRGFAIRIADVLTPSAPAWRGAALGIILLSATLMVAFFASYVLQDFALQKVPAFVARRLLDIRPLAGYL